MDLELSRSVHESGGDLHKRKGVRNSNRIPEHKHSSYSFNLLRSKFQFSCEN